MWDMKGRGEGLLGSPSPILTGTQALRAHTLLPPPTPDPIVLPQESSVTGQMSAASRPAPSSRPSSTTWTSPRRPRPCSCSSSPPWPPARKRSSSCWSSARWVLAPCNPRARLPPPGPCLVVWYYSTLPAGGSLEQTLSFSSSQKVHWG